MNKILLFGTVIFSILAFCGHKAFAQLREENKHYKELLEAQRNNVEFMALSEQISRLAGELDSQRNGQNEMEPDSKLIQKTNRMLLSNTKETCRKLQAFSMRNG